MARLNRQERASAQAAEVTCFTRRELWTDASKRRTGGYKLFLPLVPYLDSLRWVFIAAALAGIAVAIYARIDD